MTMSEWMPRVVEFGLDRGSDAGRRRHNAHCTRCYGPAFHGAGALRCERVGGCLADVEPSGQVWCRAGAEMPERYFWHEANPTLRYATRELAVAAWREAVIAKAKREAGL